MEYLINDEKIWIDDIWEKLDNKLKVVAERSKDKLPFWSNGKMHDNHSGLDEIHNWTNGFWPGLMWLMYIGTEREIYKTTAEWGEACLDRAFEEPEKLNHDVGFMWLLASRPNYELNGNYKSWQRLRRVADHLMGRYNPIGEYFRAWNSANPGENAGWTIIDTMMNLPVLYWASRETKDPRFQFAAMKHADKVMKYHVRPDGSVNHIVVYDPMTGEFLEDRGGQGFEKGSSWSRGQAWALYGFVLNYLYTEKQEYLDTAKRVAHYFIANVCDDWLTKCDFRSPKEPVYYDSSAGAAAACGLIELAGVVSQYEKRLYLKAAMNLLKAMENHYADWSPETDFIIGMSSGAYKVNQNRNIIFADYYFAEAIYKLKGLRPLFW